ncbi:hypothetical protein C2G38_2075607 [Gigaspora rosea]|uniref:Uncharacterized protein n=1 Tax=Gigaspora rosea TaxID=44941 RepID=A0A397VR57_9GLOM|nr:hypothetical protein C2G38_2075607 [Gigaspora rosea]
MFYSPDLIFFIKNPFSLWFFSVFFIYMMTSTLFHIFLPFLQKKLFSDQFASLPKQFGNSKMFMPP